MVRNQLVAGYLALQKRDSAEKLLDEALKENPKDVDALLQRGQVYLLSGKLDNLEADMTQVLKFKPDSGEAHYLMARLHRARLNPKNEQRELYEALKHSPNLLAARIDMAQSMIASGGGKAALDVLEAAPAEQKETLSYVVQRNWALFSMKDIPRFKEGIQRGYKFGRVPDVILQEALLIMGERKFGPARELMKEALKANPQDLRIVQALAESHLAESKNIPAAVAEIQAAAQQNPKYAPLQQLLGNWQVASGKVEEARKSFELARNADPNFRGASLAIAQVDLATGKLEDARNNLTQLIGKDPKDSSAALLLAMIDERAGRVDKATESYRKVVELEPTNPVALNNLAYRLVQDKKRADEALQMAQRAKESSPTNSAIDDTLGWIYFQKGLYSTAVKHLEAATSGPNPTPVRLYHLAMAYQKAGSSLKARDAYAKATKMAPKLPEADQAKQVLGIAN
jgi:tetratricopeptide (TPR) repeat protein